MKKLNICVTKNCLIKALRTFLQTAIGYILANLSLYISGIDFNDGNVVKNVLIGLAISAFSAGASAVMNLEKGEEKQDG
ncbi:MAG: hypothetical protein U0L76_03990 [Ruminococcus sp.]|nr:hypothetical protein [Ruminococcus sp.]